jgi:putative transposase
MLRSRIDVCQIVPTPEEKEELLRWGAMFNHKIAGVMEVVKPATYRKWLRMKRRKRIFKPSGRPRIPECVRKIVRRMAVEDVLWGFEQIVAFARLGKRL